MAPIPYYVSPAMQQLDVSIVYSYELDNREAIVTSYVIVSLL